VKLPLRSLLLSSIVVRLMVIVCLVGSSAAAHGQRLTNAGRVFEFVTCPDDQQCFTFDRPHNKINGTTLSAASFTNPLTTGIAAAVVSSKIIFSGTVLRIDVGQDCSDREWYVVTQTNESASVLIYNPTDIGTEYCDFATPNPAGVGTKQFIYLVLPVRVVWAEVIGYRVTRGDSFHKLPGQISGSAFVGCNPPFIASASPTSPGSAVNPGSALNLCDQNDRAVKWFYGTGSAYNVLIQPGTGSGAISYTPVIGNTSSSYSFDVQFTPSFRPIKSNNHWYNGWIGTPFVLEKSGTQSGNLDSLTGALSYEIHPEKGGNIAPRRTVPPTWSWVNMRAVKFQVLTGVEYAPTTPHDLNTVQSELLKMPVVVTINKQPSALTIYPLFALEQVQHIATHLPNETSMTTREVAGGDASLRWPFGLFNNLFGDKPITTDFTYRYRWLSNPEPTTDYQSAAPKTTPPEFFSAESHSYMRAAVSAPLSSYVQFKVSVQHGALPPDFHSLGYTLQLGLNFSDPGSAEH
jgi:hypothetical protein